MSALYNRAVYWPDHVADAVQELVGSFETHECQYSQHARDEAENDRYGRICLPPRIQITHKDVFEVQIIRHQIHKFLIRVPFDKTRDLIFVLLNRAPGKLFCKTVWINKRSDTHRTLRRENYVQKKSA